MYYPRNISPAPRRESICTRAGYVTETKTRVIESAGPPELVHEAKSVYRRFFVDKAWSEEGAITYILAGGRFNFDDVDFDSPASRSAAMEAQATRDFLRTL